MASRIRSTHRQVNNLRIRPYRVLTNGQDQICWKVLAPDGRWLESFVRRENAERWCQFTLDFVSDRTYRRLTGHPRSPA